MPVAYPMLTFYLLVFGTAFLFKIPAGPVNLDIFHHAVKKHYPQAVFTAAGAAIGDGIWAICAFLGISPFISHPQMEATLLVATAIITACLGISMFRNSKFMKHHDEAIAKKVKKKRWSFVRGFSFIIINPLVFVGWVITLSFLRKSKIYIPHELNYEILLFIVVSAGTASYFSLLIFITNRMKRFLNPQKTAAITKYLGYILLGLSAYFLFYAAKLYFFNEKLIS